MAQTPRQAVTWLRHHRAIKRQRRADELYIAAMGARGEGKQVDRTIKEWQTSDGD